MPRKWSALLLLLILCLGCSREAGTPRGEASFYYWQTVVDIQPQERQLLEHLAVKRLYVRFFDVVWNGAESRAEPTGIVRFQAPLDGLECVPVVFIDNEVFRRLPPAGIAPLCRQVDELLSRLQREFAPATPERQLDCDWDLSTRAAFFTFAEEFKKASSPTRVSATLRLHQVRNRSQEGIPPVDRGMLMVYHTGSPYDFTAGNSILDPAAAKGYLADLDRYPLPLDVALPIFSWVAQFDSSNRFIRLFHGLSRRDLEVHPLLEPGSPGLYQARRDAWLQGKRLMAGDILKLEEASYPAVMECCRFLAAKVKGKRLHVVFFHLSLPLIEEFTNGEPEKIGKMVDPF